MVRFAPCATSTLFLSPRRIPNLDAPVKPATPLKFHKASVERKYRRIDAFLVGRVEDFHLLVNVPCRAQLQ